MADENNKEQKEKETEENLTEIDIAELASKELRKKEEEIAKLKKDLAKAKLYSEAEEEEEKTLTREECIKRISDNRTTNYDYAEAVIGIVDDEISKGNPNPLGKDGEAVYKFFKDVIEECDGDKSRFPSIYQARLGADDPSVAMAYKKRNR